jgi:diguanylate cyclase (GGDEF)-like protein
VIDFSITYIKVLLIASAISFLLGLLIARQRNVNGSGSLAISMVLLGFWTFFSAAEGSAADPATKILWAKIQYIPAVNVVPFFVVFMLVYTKRIRSPRPAWIYLLWLIPLITLALTWTNEWHGLVWSGFLPVDPASKLMRYLHGPAYWVMISYTFLLVLFMLGLLVAEMYHAAHRRYRMQNLLMFLVILIPTIGGIVYNSGFNPIPGLDWSPVLILISAILMSTSVIWFDFMDIVPVARTFLMDQMEFGFIVIDPNLRVVDLNPAVTRFFQDQKISLGADAGKLLAGMGLGDLKLPSNGEVFQRELFGNGENWYCLDFKLSELHYKNRFLGWLAEFRDISNEKRISQDKEKINLLLNEKLKQVEALQNIMKEQAIRDPLTNVYNRRFFDESFERELALAKRTGREMCILMIDIDHFKEVNDRFGHFQGDRVLQEFGSLLLNNTRESDVVCRYGGEEFAILLPNLPMENALQRADQLRKTFEDTCFKEQDLDQDLQIRLTISIGLSSYPKHGETQQVLIRKADEAMYVAKNSGRNRIEVLS